MVLIKCRNPYFIGILSAILHYLFEGQNCMCRNPYFIGILSAIMNIKKLKIILKEVAILILLESFLQ